MPHMQIFTRQIARTAPVSAARTSATAERVTFHTIRGNTMALREWGPADGPLVVGIHGLSANSISFADVAEKAASQGYHVVAPDLRGRNLSPATGRFSYGHENHARDIKAISELFTRQIKTKDVTLIGHSMGGLIAMHASRIMPNVKKVVLLDVLGMPELGAVNAISHATDRLEKDYASVDAYVDSQRKSGVIKPFNATWRRHYAEEVARGDDGRYHVRSSRDAILEDSASASTHLPETFWQFLPKDTMLVKAGVPLAPVLGNVVSEWEVQWLARTKPGFKPVTVNANHYGVITDPKAITAIAGFLGPAAKP